MNEIAASKTDKYAGGNTIPHVEPCLDFRALWQKYYPKLALFVRPFFKHQGDCEDAVQEIFFRIFRSIESYDRRFSVGTWIYRIARNYCIDCGRKNERRAKLMEQRPDCESEARKEDAFNPEHAVLINEVKDKIRTAIGSLEPTDQQICFLHYFEDLTIREMNGVLKMPVGTLKSRMYGIRLALRDFLEAHYG